MENRKLTVLQVLPALESGGVEKGTLEIAESLVEAGHRSMVMSAGGRLVDELVAQGSEHYQWTIGKKSLLTLLLIRKLRRFLIDQKVDVVHARSRLPAWIVYLAWKKMDPATRPKFVTTVHGFNSVSWYSKIMTKGEVVIAVSNSVKEFILENYLDTDPNKIVVIYRGIDPEVYPYGFKPSDIWLEKWYTDYPQLKNKKIVTLPGRITRLKGHEDFIEIMADLVKAEPDVMGVVAGGYESAKKDYYDEIVNLVESKGLSKKIIFTGYRNDMREVLAISNVVLSLTQKPESFGRTTLEALAMGVPVVGYDHGGVGEQLNELFPQGAVFRQDSRGIERKIRHLIDSEDSKPRLHNHYLIEKMQRQTIDLYHI